MVYFEWMMVKKIHKHVNDIHEYLSQKTSWVSSSSSSSSAFHILGLMACYGLKAVFEGSSQRSLSIWLVLMV
jgi:hypothetical protein